MYSVEHKPKYELFNCWNQFAVTDSKFMSKLYAFELRLRSTEIEVRVREI